MRLTGVLGEDPRIPGVSCQGEDIAEARASFPLYIGPGRVFGHARYAPIIVRHPLL